MDTKQEKEPLLGFATTRMLLEEILVRGEIAALMEKRGEGGDLMHDLAKVLLKTLPATTLLYRTVDGYKEGK